MGGIFGCRVVAERTSAAADVGGVDLQVEHIGGLLAEPEELQSMAREARGLVMDQDNVRYLFPSYL